MRKFGLPAAMLVLGAAAFLGLSGQWPWHRLGTATMAPAAVVPPPARFTQIVDTLHLGETLSDLFARHRIAGIDFHRLDPSLSLDPRRLRPGLVFSFLRHEGDTAPTRIMVRTSPEQRVTFNRASQGWNTEAQPIRWRSEEARIEGAIDNSLYEALDAGVSDEQKGKLDAAFKDASAEVLGLANTAIASGDLTPYQRNSRGVLAFVGSTVGTADALDQRLHGILSPEQIGVMEESGFDPLEYLGVTTSWESANPPPPPPRTGL